MTTGIRESLAAAKEGVRTGKTKNQLRTDQIMARLAEGPACDECLRKVIGEELILPARRLTQQLANYDRVTRGRSVCACGYVGPISALPGTELPPVPEGRTSRPRTGTRSSQMEAILARLAIIEQHLGIVSPVTAAEPPQVQATPDASTKKPPRGKGEKKGPTLAAVS